VDDFGMCDDLIEPIGDPDRVDEAALTNIASTSITAQVGW